MYWHTHRCTILIWLNTKPTNDLESIDLRISRDFAIYVSWVLVGVFWVPYPCYISYVSICLFIVLSFGIKMLKIIWRVVTPEPRAAQERQFIYEAASTSPVARSTNILISDFVSPPSLARMLARGRDSPYAANWLDWPPACSYACKGSWFALCGKLTWLTWLPGVVNNTQ